MRIFIFEQLHYQLQQTVINRPFYPTHSEENQGLSCDEQTPETCVRLREGQVHKI